ncbi:MAG TPA: hypothetical protein VGG39_19820 [Polyangiaceae bacterium]|jgi:hypothetical protein
MAPTSTSWREVEGLVGEIEALQQAKVLDLARRLRPGLSLEDVANPHDFPELADADWQYQDGLLAGVQTVLAAVRARRRETEGGSP